MLKSFIQPAVLVVASAVAILAGNAVAAEPFIHPGGLHTKADLDRMRDRVAAHESPWIESWNELVGDPKAQLDYKPAPRANMGASRQRAAADAVAIYLLAVRGYVSGDARYTDRAIEICNQWSAAVNRKPSGSDQPGLNGIFTYQFAVDGELLRMYVGDRWKQGDFDRFKAMLRDDLYPVCHDFLVRHNDACITHWWTNWDACNITAVAAIGVLLDDRAMFDEAIEYYKHGVGNGCIEKAVYFIHPNGLGQWQEAGRDMEHASLGVGLLSTFCQIAWNQGVDMYSYDNNRLLAGAEYVARYELWKPVPYKPYNNCDDVNNYWITRGLRGRLQRPIWELIYNHYVVLQGLQAPNVTAIAALNRPEGFTHDDHFGYGTLAFTLKPSQYPPLPVPAVPQGLKATPGVGHLLIEWNVPEGANGFTVQRATSADGPFEEIANYRGVMPEYDDRKVENGTAYYYKICAKNQAGESAFSQTISATPVAADDKLPEGWSVHDIGQVAAAGKAEYAPVGEGTFVATGAGASLVGQAEGMLPEGSTKPRGPVLAESTDGISFTCKRVDGDVVLTARLVEMNLRGSAKGSRIGITLRASLDPNAACVAMTLGDEGYRVAHFGQRPASGQRMELVRGNAYSGPSTWFRLVRSGNTFTGYQSADGQDWHAVNSATFDMPATTYAGIAVSSASKNLISATFDHVSLK